MDPGELELEIAFGLGMDPGKSWELKRKLGLELSQRDEETLVNHYNNVIRSEVEALASKGKAADSSLKRSRNAPT